MSDRFFLISGTRNTNFSRLHFLFVQPFFFSYLGTRNTNFSRSHFLFIFEFGMSDRFFSHIWGQGILTFFDRISCLFSSSVCPTVISHIWDKEY
jgi:hypothetical protein